MKFRRSLRPLIKSMIKEVSRRYPAISSVQFRSRFAHPADAFWNFAFREIGKKGAPSPLGNQDFPYHLIDRQPSSFGLSPISFFDLSGQIESQSHEPSRILSA